MKVIIQLTREEYNEYLKIAKENDITSVSEIDTLIKETVYDCIGDYIYEADIDVKNN